MSRVWRRKLLRAQRTAIQLPQMHSSAMYIVPRRQPTYYSSKQHRRLQRPGKNNAVGAAGQSSHRTTRQPAQNSRAKSSVCHSVPNRMSVPCVLADARGTLASARGTLTSARGTLASARGTLMIPHLRCCHLPRAAV
jgi:hypothetical protein